MRRITLKRACLIVGALSLLAITVAAQRGTTQRVHFPRGRTTAVLHGAVVRGTEDRYILGARSGQTMIVHITAREKNAAFTIYGPDGNTLRGAGEGDDATDFSGELPLSGDYTIAVGPTRGNASYTLEVTIR
jgi:hypothetical protein